jgi:hypothetical protein
MPTVPLVSVQYMLGVAGGVTLLVKDPKMMLVLDATQADLLALLPDGMPPGTPWDDAEAILAAQTILDERFPDAGYVVVAPEEPM